MNAADTSSPDPVLWNDWHPVAYGDRLAPGSLQKVELLDHRFVLWRQADGSVHAWTDRCPHRGAAFTLGRVVDDHLMCPYHGWRFDGDGRCTLRPAQPGSALPPQVMITAHAVQERFGIVWLCPGEPTRDVVPFEEFADERLGNIYAGPYEVDAAGPRVVENFIDMAHFSFVHEGILGDPAVTEILPYEVESFSDAGGQPGVRAVDLRVMQPRANLQAEANSDVVYTYRISRPLLAILTKEVVGTGVPEAITLFVQPVSEVRSRVFMVFSAVRSDEPESAVLEFQDAVFHQDGPVLESQQPKRMPLDPREEISQKADALSLAYRRYLRDSGLQYGVIP